MNPNSTETTKIRVFDLDVFEPKSLDVSFSYSKVSTEEDANTVLTSLNKDAKIELADTLKRKEAMLAAREAARGNAVPLTFVSKFVAPFKMLPQFSSIKNEDEQQKAIYAFLRSQPGLIEAIKQGASQDTSDE